MSLVPVKDMHNPAIDNLIQASLESEERHLRLKWISYEEISDIEPTKFSDVYCATIRKDDTISGIMLLSLGSNEECTPTLVSAFAKRYSLPTHKYNNDVSQFRRYSVWLKERNKLIKDFTKYEATVTDKRF